MQEPAQGRHAEIISAHAVIEMLGCQRRHLSAAPGVGEIFLARIVRGRRGADHQGAVVELAHRPGEFEKAMREDQHHCDDLGFPQRPAGLHGEGDVAHYGDDVLQRAEHREQAGHDEDGRRGEEGGVIERAVDDLDIDHAVLAGQHFDHPAFAVARHDPDEVSARRLALGKSRVAEPAQQQPCHRNDIVDMSLQHVASVRRRRLWRDRPRATTG